jgi:DNA-binding NtrC family response regulator
MRELFTLLERLAGTELALLLEGPTGSGKELAARAIHAESAHASGPFVVLDCTAIPVTLAESVLFGHERGAFTGANERRPGVFEAAGEGTVFLDEVGELPIDLQPKLLRALEQRQVVRVGSSQPIPVRARVLSATWRDLRARINQGTFREDLYYRLAQARVPLPALRERSEDVPLLVRHMLERLPNTGRSARSISPEALKELCQREYAGNVRELRHTVERAAMLAEGDTILPSDLAFERMLMGECRRSGSATTEVADPGESMPPPAAEGSLPMFKEAKRTAIEEFERDYLARLLSRAGNNLSRASALAGVERHHLRDLLRKRGLWGQ